MLVDRGKKRDYIKYFSLILLSCIFIISITACGGGGGNGTPPQPPPGPSVTSANPASFATEVSMDTQVQATFNVDMDPTSINTTSFLLTSPSGIYVSGTVSYDTGPKTATFNPSYSLAPLTTYTATISGARDAAGNTMSDFSWSFVTVTGFWAYDFMFDSTYFASASFVGEGDHCLVYLEDGQFVDPNTINEIVTQFDYAIYTNEILAFGDEPNPGIDGNSKVYIFLLDIRDGYTPSSKSYVAGYFNPLDEYNISAMNLHSNQKELFNMDIYPAVPGDGEFLRTLAHEFQHMISWNQKTNLRGVNEDTWLEEALSEIAPLFCSYGPDYSRVIGYQLRPWDSLIGWDSTTSDYATVYMWAQHIYDQVKNTDGTGHNVFWNINHTANVGINAVNTGLNAVGYGKDFSGIFRDWSMANYLGRTTITGYPEWSYTSIYTEAGHITEFGPLPGLPVNDVDHINASVVGGLHRWGLDYFEFTKTGAGTVTWSRTDPTDEAAFIDMNTHTVTFNMESGTAYPYTNSGILITRNPTYSEKWTETGGGTMTFTSVRAKDTLMSTYLSKRPHLNEKSSALSTPKALLLQVSSDPLTKALSDKTGRPVSVCVDHFFREREKSLRKELLKNN